MNDVPELNDTYIASGKELDIHIGGGFKKNEVNLVASRPGIGMTSWLLECAFHMSQNNHNILYVTLQSSIPDTIEYVVRVIGSERLTHIPAHSFEIAEAFDVNMKTLDKLIGTNIENHQTKVVFVDTLDYIFTEQNGQLISPLTSFNDEVEVMEEFRKLSKKHNLTFIIGKQLDPMKKNRPDKRPLITDVDTKMKTEQLPLIIGLYRDEVYNPETINENELEIHLLKSPTESTVAFYTEVFEKNRKEKNQV